MKGAALAVIIVLAAGLGWWFYQSTTTDGKNSKEVSGNPEEDHGLRPGIKIRPIPKKLHWNERDKKKIALGDMLFHDKLFSKDHTVSCASCHDLENKAGTDRMMKAMGVEGMEGTHNSPTVFNSGYNFKQFWDGRAETLEEQIEGPLNSTAEMATSWDQVVPRIKAKPDYVKTFDEVYDGKVNPENIKNAIALFEKSLITPNSRFDRWLRNDDTALDLEELKGWKLFEEIGCVSCHQGIGIGGNVFQRFPTLNGGEYFKNKGGAVDSDKGRYNVTKKKKDMNVFKVPSLRNVAITPPYLHDGSVATLEEVVRLMAKHQVGKEDVTDDQVKAIVKFLETLTGEYKGKPLDGARAKKETPDKNSTGESQ